MSFKLSSAFLIALGAFPAYSQTIDGGSIVTVPGSQSSPWNLGASSLTVGNTSTGTLQIGATGVVSNGSGFIGRQVGSTGHVTVSGTGAQWTNSAGLSVGFSGTGTLGVSNGGVVRSTTNTYVGVAAGGTGTVTVSGLGSQLNTTGFMRVGQTGNGTLQISDSAVVSNAAAVVGYDPGSVGVVTVSGAGTQWNSSAQLSVGASGNGAVTISNDAVVSATSAVVGGAASSQGVINIGAAALAAAAAPGTLSLTGPSPSLTLGATGGLVFNHTNTAGYVFTPGITGAGKLSTYNGTTILTANNNYTGGTTIAGGTLQLGNGGTSGAIVGNVANNGILNFNRTDSVTFAGLISGSGVVNQNGTGATILTANNTYTGGTAIAAGTLQLGNGGTTGAIVGNVANNGALVFDRSNTLTFAGQISGSGSVSQIGAGTAVLTGNNTYAGGTTISAGTLQLGDGGSSGAILGNVTNNGALAFNRSDTVAFPGLISGSGVVNQIGAGTTILTADNTYTGGTTISAGTLQLGNGGTSGAILGNVANNGALTFNRSDVQTFSGLISGSGRVNQIGSGTTILTADNTYTGSTTISAGTLQLGNGGTSGAILGNVVDNGALTFNRSDTMTLAGQISGSGVVNQIGTGTTVLTGNNSYTGGTTIAAGTLQLGDGGASGAIVGNVANNGVLAFNRSDVVTFAGQISGSGVVNQIGSGTTILTADNTYTGGTTISAGTLQLGNGGTIGAILGDVANNGTLSFNRADVQTFPGLISGSGTVNQIGTGTTILTADNAYTGGTTISAGTLQLGNGGTSGAILGDVSNNGALTFNRADIQTFPGLISGSGTVNQIGTGTTILTVNNTYTGGTTISAGTLQLGNGGTTGAILGNVDNNGALTFNRSDVQTFAGLISGSGVVNQIGTGTTILTADNTYTGGTTISAGTLQLGNGGTSGAILGDVANSGALSFNRSDAVTFAGLISGSGTVNQNGTGTTILTAQNTHGGPTNVNNGVLRAGAASTLSPNSAVNVAAAGTLDLSGYNQTVAGVTNAGLINMGTGTAPGTTLTTPNYAGQGGRIAMNTLLGDDSSPSDRLVINGGTASGSSSLIVTNAGGAGAVTTGNGILLVDAVNGGTTATSAFTLGNAGGYVAAGPYAYTLQRSSVDASGLQNWYLRSTVDCAAAPSNPACKNPEPPVPPNPPEPPVPPNPPTPVPPAPPNYRPEVSTAVATPELALRYGSTFLDSLHERIGEARYALPSTPTGSNSLAWGRVIGVTGERNGSNSGILGSRGPDYDYKIYGLQSGVDLYRRANANGSMDHAGAYVAFGRATADVDHLDGRSAGQAAMNGVTLGGYWTHIGKEGWYVDAVIQGTRYDVDNGRSPAGYNLDTRGFGFATSLEGGYPFRLNDEWVIEPQAQLVFQNVNLNDANDGAAKIRFNDVDSLRGRLGVRLARTVELDPGPDGKRVATTWLRASLVNEFLTNPTTEFSSQNGYVPFRADMKGASVQLNLGADVGVKRNVSMYGSVGSEISLRGDGQNFNGKLGVKIAF
ncbi:autotransporter-associated beta strand repeat-containing protein [Achromobacter xylosoxidans]|uniref:autotransporter-associated beta strand repeat-containing protein n=1 Tax=Alcaligenes xylosoxydans xylosoxydans TaxID=85698 RepID=UPI001402FE9D|nr:autotransporter-associated beta strand repeat-containing protein [Achromobacter xylosoxidans]MBC9904980.1 autotransporter outer membrane beta-barrel domain-containing protein [Achromobacter xylosoxidans]MBD0867468.1 autotransporter outer membrane beta-barrel domain-containing protein [Achromobacter xylosoxidans]QNP88481.1 autotransporter outer membrane beta-barrel domain-containing protein [Achromobacter xylosoxidans]